MATDAGKLRIQGVDMDEIVPFCIDLFKRFAAPLREDEMTRFTVAGFNRHLAVGCQVFAAPQEIQMTTDKAAPILESENGRE